MNRGGSPAPLLLAASALLAAACPRGTEPAGAPGPAARKAVPRAAPREGGAAPSGGGITPALPPPDDGDRLVEAHHRQWVSGDLAGARRLLQQIAGRSGARRSLRALAALRLASIDEVSGDRRAALAQLDRVKLLAGSGHPLTLEAEDRRARILTATPLADVRGPVPGSVTLKGEPPPIAARFRHAEKLLASYHRVVVAPSLENINEVLRTKRRALSAAVNVYQELAARGGPAAQAAASFRIGAMYHHLAEALAFESPSELLPSLARRLSRQLHAESAGYLRRALASYRSALRLPPGPATVPWLQLARREAETLEVVLRAGTGRRGSRAP